MFYFCFYWGNNCSFWGNNYPFWGNNCPFWGNTADRFCLSERNQRDVASNTPYCCLKSTWCRLNFFVIINQINTLRRLRQLRQLRQLRRLRRLRRHVFPIYIKRVNDLNGDNHHADHPDNHNEQRYSWSFYPVGGERCTSGSSLWWSRVWLKWPHPTSFIEDNRKKSGKYLPE